MHDFLMKPKTDFAFGLSEESAKEQLLQYA